MVLVDLPAFGRQGPVHFAIAEDPSAKRGCGIIGRPSLVALRFGVSRMCNGFSPGGIGSAGHLHDIDFATAVIKALEHQVRLCQSYRHALRNVDLATLWAVGSLIPEPFRRPARGPPAYDVAGIVALTSGVSWL